MDPSLPAVDQHGGVIDVLLSTRRDRAARRFFARALRASARAAQVRLGLSAGLELRFRTGF
jgi:transposase-like protein